MIQPSSVSPARTRPSEFPNSTVHDLANAKSLTVILHGIGATTSEKLLTQAIEGFFDSGLGDTPERLTLPECPTLFREKGAKGLVISGSRGEHFLIALPWGNHRVRLSSIARLFALGLLLLIATMTISFVFKGPLDAAATWLLSWLHKVLLGIALFVISFVAHLFSSTDKPYEAPSMFYVFLPPFLLMGLSFFTWYAEDLWIVVGCLIVALWAVAGLIIVRCVPRAPTYGWRVTLLALLVSLSLAVAGAIRAEWHFTRYIASHNRTDGLYLPYLPYFLYRDKDFPLSIKEPAARQQGWLAQIRQSWRSLLGESSEAKQTDKPYDHRSSNNSGKPEDPYLEDSMWPRRDLSKPLKGSEILLPPIPIPSVRGITKELLPSIIFGAISIAACLFAVSFYWLLDFALDVLNYGANEKYRASLVAGTVETVSWLRSQAPCASLIVVGHSLGSVIASHAVSAIAAEPTVSQVALITLGSPLNYLYRVFPKEVRSPRELSVMIYSKARWINLWRRSDPIGKKLDLEAGSSVQYCVGSGGHNNYWSDGAVWKAVAYEALRIGECPHISSTASSQCLLETRLRMLAFTGITLMVLCGAGLWTLSF